MLIFAESLAFFSTSFTNNLIYADLISRKDAKNNFASLFEINNHQ
jgi:hypothetical protein